MWYRLLMNFSKFFLTLSELNDSCFTLFFYFLLSFSGFGACSISTSSVEQKFCTARIYSGNGIIPVQPRTRSIKRFVADTGCRINLRSILQSTLWLKARSPRVVMKALSTSPSPVRSLIRSIALLTMTTGF